MALPSVNLVLDLYAGLDPLSSGTAALKPSAVLTAVQDQAVVTRQPVPVTFGGDSPPVVPLIPTDDPDLEPSGWTWGISFGAPGAPAPYSFFLPAGPADFTATHATPAVFTFTPTTQLTELPNGTGVQLAGGSLPAGFTADTTYYVVGASEDTFELAATSGGDPIASTGTGSGSLTVAQWNLSALTPVGSTTQMTPYLPLPSGTPSSGKVPVATGEGNETAWGSPPLANTAVTAGTYTNADITVGADGRITAASDGEGGGGGGTLDTYIAPKVTVIDPASSVTIDASSGNTFTLNMAEDTTLAFSNAAPGETVSLWVLGNGFALTLPVGVIYGSVGEPTLTGDEWDLLGFEYAPWASQWCLVAFGPGYSVPATIAYRDSGSTQADTGTTATLAIPEDVEAGDVILIGVCGGGGGGATGLSVASDGTTQPEQLGETLTGEFGSLSQIWTMTAAEGDAGATLTVTGTGGTSPLELGIGLGAWSGAALPPDVYTSTATSSDPAETYTAPTVTTTAANDWGIEISLTPVNGFLTITTPEALTARSVNTNLVIVSDTNGPVDSGTVVGGGDYSTSGDVVWHLWVIALQPA